MIQNIKSALLPAPGFRHQDAALAGAAWTTPFGLNHTQATFRLPTRGSTTAGLEVLIPRAQADALASDGFNVVFTRVDGNAVAAATDASAKTITGNVKNATTMAQLKALLESAAGGGYQTRYYGAETGTGAAEARGNADSAHADAIVSAGARKNTAALVKVTTTGDTLIAIAAAAPGNDDGAVIVLENEVEFFTVPAGQDLHLKRIGNTSVRASAELWRDVPGITEF